MALSRRSASGGKRAPSQGHAALDDVAVCLHTAFDATQHGDRVFERFHAGVEKGRFVAVAGRHRIVDAAQDFAQQFAADLLQASAHLVALSILETGNLDVVEVDVDFLHRCDGRVLCRDGGAS